MRRLIGLIGEAVGQPEIEDHQGGFWPDLMRKMAQRRVVRLQCGDLKAAMANQRGNTVEIRPNHRHSERFQSAAGRLGGRAGLQQRREKEIEMASISEFLTLLDGIEMV